MSVGILKYSYLILCLFCIVELTNSSRTKYVPKWRKQACEIPALQNEHSHYTCGDNGEVKCLPGWTGDVCDVPICKKGCDPLQGYCKRPGECRCKLGFYGELCNKCIALPGCQHGYCNNSFECICEEGWDGLFCSEPICRLDCHATRGYCDWPGECSADLPLIKYGEGSCGDFFCLTKGSDEPNIFSFDEETARVSSHTTGSCRLGWSGETCKDCQVLPGCQHGTCTKPLECKCNKGYTGILCQTPICSEKCHKDHGYCLKPGECRCKVGWWGENCEKCYAYPGCKHGTCKRPWECNCEEGWGGLLCDQELTFCDNNSGLCENGGTCVSLTEEDGNFKCICSDHYYGKHCEKMKMPEEIYPVNATIPMTTSTEVSDRGKPILSTSKKSSTKVMTTQKAIITSAKVTEKPILQVATTTTTTESKDEKINEA